MIQRTFSAEKSGFYPLNISDIFHMLLFTKIKENVMNRKFLDFDVKYRIYFTFETGFFPIFTRASISWIYQKSCITHKFHIHVNQHQCPVLFNVLVKLTWNLFLTKFIAYIVVKVCDQKQLVRVNHISKNRAQTN